MDTPTHILVEIPGASVLYTYFNHEAGIALGDHVVVKLPNGKLALGEVVSIAPTAEQRAKATKWVVQKVTIDTAKYDMLTALEPPPARKVKKHYVKPTPEQLRQMIEAYTKTKGE